MQKTIYVKDQDEWDEVKRRAEENGQTVSRYLLGGVSQLDKIEKKLDELFNNLIDNRVLSGKSTNTKGMVSKSHKNPKGTPASIVESPLKSIRERKIESSKGKDLSPKISKSDDQMLRRAQELAAKKKPESLTGWSGGISKAQQVGKKDEK